MRKSLKHAVHNHGLRITALTRSLKSSNIYDTGRQTFQRRTVDGKTDSL